MRILVTGAAGFIGSTVAHALLERGDQIVGVDNLNDYYDVTLKQARLARLQARDGFDFHRVNIADAAAFNRTFQRGLKLGSGCLLKDVCCYSLTMVTLQQSA